MNFAELRVGDLLKIIRECKEMHVSKISLGIEKVEIEYYQHVQPMQVVMQQQNEILKEEIARVQEKVLDVENKKSKLDVIANLVTENPELLEELEANNALSSSDEDFDEET